MTSFLISCENATCTVPEAHRELFRGSEEIVTSPLGWEAGALNLAQGFAMRFRTPLVHGEVTRLLIDLEKLGDACWSDISRTLSDTTRTRLMDRHHRTYWNSLEQRIKEDLRRHRTVLHLMVHTDADSEAKVILQTSPDAEAAEQIAAKWADLMADPEIWVEHQKEIEIAPAAVALSDKLSAPNYAQIVLRVSQSFFLNARPWRWEALKKHLLTTLDQAVV